MLCKRSSLIICGALLFVAWNAVLIFVLLGRSPNGQLGEPGYEEGKKHKDGNVIKELMHLVNAFETELESQNKILQQIQKHKSLWEEKKDTETDEKSKTDKKSKTDEKSKTKEPPHAVIPILVIACNRVTVKRCLDKLLEYRPSAELYPIIVSQDCGHTETANVIASYGSQLTHIKQPDLSDISVPVAHRKFQGYYKISRHYHWALNQVFNTFSYSSVVIVEDDLEVLFDNLTSHISLTHFCMSGICS